MGAEQQDKSADAQSTPAQGDQKREPWWWQQPNPIDRFTGWLVAFTALLFIATVFNAVILWITDHTLKSTLEANNRAWIAPVAAVLQSVPKVGEPIKFSLNFRNSGQSPALKYAYVMAHLVVPEGTLMDDITKLDICGRVALPGTGTLFPSSQPIDAAAFPSGQEMIFTDEIAAEKQYAIWQGCFRYYTFDKPRRTRFCYWFRRSGTQWYWHSCGIEAD